MTWILKLDIAGRPIDWVSAEAGALLYCREQVAWEAGTSGVTLHGGISRQTGRQSTLEINSIVATRGINVSGQLANDRAALSNAQLFRRDGFLCLYCGEAFPRGLLTRDHVVPRSKGGSDRWENVVTSCRACNQRKDNRTPDEARMPLLAVPYAPNRAEALILSNRNILTDQMTFLRRRVGSGSRLRLD